MKSLRPDYRPDPLVIEVLQAADALAREQTLAWCIVGATARDLLLTGVHGIDTGSATRDVDLAIAVAGWDQYAAFRAALIQSGRFTASDDALHRFRFRGAHPYPLDIIPFGGVAAENHTIAWPPDMAVVMNIAGYEDVFAHSVPVELAPDFVVRIVSLDGLALLKLFAWADRRDKTSRDASDFRLILRTYCDAGNLDRLYDTEAALLEHAGFDPERAAAILLGRDVQRMSSAPTLRQVLALLQDERQRTRLEIDMVRGKPYAGDASDMLDLFVAGLGWQSV